MLTLSERLGERIEEARAVSDALVLPFELRSRSRLRARLVSGEEVAVSLPRGQILRGGDLLRASDGRIVEVRAADELVSTASSKDARVLARAAYHLGNRHVGLQLGAGWMRYSHDPVLDDLLARLGLEVTVEQAPFEPEAGAYRGGVDHEHSHS